MHVHNRLSTDGARGRLVVCKHAMRAAYSVVFGKLVHDVLKDIFHGELRLRYGIPGELSNPLDLQGLPT